MFFILIWPIQIWVPFHRFFLNGCGILGLNLRVTGHCNQGGRKYMEDVFSVAYQQTEDELDLEYAFFGIYDGHGGKEAALFAKVIIICQGSGARPF
jgi:hypothetical protein